MAAITWRSLMQEPDYRGAGSIIGASQNSFNSAFDAFNRILKDRQSFEAGQAADVQEGIKQNYLDQLAGYKTPEALAAAQASGQLVAPVDRLTAANRASVRGAEDARLTGLRQAVTANRAYEEGEATAAAKPLVDLTQSLIARGEFAAANQVLGTRDMPNEAPLYKAIQDAQLIKTAQGRVEEDRKRLVEVERPRADEIAGFQLTAARTAAEDSTRARAIDTGAAQMAAAYQAETATKRKAMEDYARTNFNKSWANFIPMTKDGQIDTAQMSSGMKKSFNQSLKDAGIAASLDDYTSGDTGAKKNIIAAAQAKGATVADIGRLTQNLDLMLNTGASPKIGNDVVAAQTKEAQDAAISQDLAERYGAVAFSTPTDVEAGMQAAADVVKQKGISGWSADNILAETSKFLRKGIEVGTGDNKTRIMPSATMIKQLLTESNPYIWTSESDIQDVFKTWAADPQTRKQVEALYADHNKNLLKRAIPKPQAPTQK